MQATGECLVAMSGPTCMDPNCPPCQHPELEPAPPADTGEVEAWEARALREAVTELERQHDKYSVKRDETKAAEKADGADYSATRNYYEGKRDAYLHALHVLENAVTAAKGERG